MHENKGHTFLFINHLHIYPNRSSGKRIPGVSAESYIDKNQFNREKVTIVSKHIRRTLNLTR